MTYTIQTEPTGSIYHAPAIKTIRLSSRQPVLSVSGDAVNDNSIQEYSLEQGEW